MKANLPPSSGTSRYQEISLELGVPIIDERSEELPLYIGQGDPTSIKLPTETTIDSVLDEATVTTTTRLQERVVSNNQEQPGSFISNYWFYFLLMGLVGWVVLRAFANRGPSFETAWEDTVWEDQPEQANEIIGDGPRGQFKKAERFMRSVEEPPENVTPLVVSEVENKSTKQQRVNKMPMSQPADDDFDFDLRETESDSDIFSLDEAAEINKPAHASKSGESSKRFKTEEDVGASLAGEFEVDDDEFDDQDSQLSLADSDAEFGFDLDDEEPDSLLGSGKQDIETLAEDVESAGKGIGDLGLAGVVDMNPVESPVGGDEDSELVLDGIISDDSSEFSFDLEDSDEDGSACDLAAKIDAPVIEALPVFEAKADPVEDEVGDSEDNDSSEFGFGLFDDEVSDQEPVEVASDSSDDDSRVTAPVVAATAAVGAGLAGIGLAGDGFVDSAESDRQWEAKLNVIEDQNAKLSAQVTTLTKQLEEASKAEAQSESLQKEHDALTETVKSIGLEKEELLKEKEQADKEKSRLTEELEAAEKQNSTWEQEKADLLEQQEKLKAEKEAEKSRLTEELEAAEKQDSTWKQEKADLLEQQEKLKAEKEAEKSRLTEELEAAEKQNSTWEQEKADLLEQQERLKAEKEAVDSELESLTSQNDQSGSELSALQAEVGAFAQQRSEFESEIKTLQNKLADAEAKSAENGASEEIKDLRVRFNRRLAAELRERQEAEQLLEQAESQRNEVAKLLRAAKAELKEFKS